MPLGSAAAASPSPFFPSPRGTTLNSLRVQAGLEFAGTRAGFPGFNRGLEVQATVLIGHSEGDPRSVSAVDFLSGRAPGCFPRRIESFRRRGESVAYGISFPSVWGPACESLSSPPVVPVRGQGSRSARKRGILHALSGSRPVGSGVECRDLGGSATEVVRANPPLRGFGGIFSIAPDGAFLWGEVCSTDELDHHFSHGTPAHIGGRRNHWTREAGLNGIWRVAWTTGGRAPFPFSVARLSCARGVSAEGGQGSEPSSRIFEGP